MITQKFSGSGLFLLSCTILNQSFAMLEIENNQPLDPSYTPLHVAAIAGDANTINQLLEQGDDPNVRGSDGLAPLFFAFFHHHQDAKNSLLNAKIDVNARDPYGRTALFYATAWGTAEDVSTLLEKSANPTIADNYGNTPLHYAVLYNTPPNYTQYGKVGGNIAAIRYLLDAKANRDADDNEGRTPLYHAAQLGQLYTALFLVVNGANPCIADKKGHTARRATRDLRKKGNENLDHFLKQTDAHLAQSEQEWQKKQLPK